MIKKEPTRLDRLNKIYDISEQSDLSRIFGDRTKYMRNIKYEGDHKGYDMYSFVDIHDMNDLQTCCPELNTWNSDQGEFNGDIKAQLEDLKDGIDSTINFAKRHNGKIYSFVLDKLVTV